MKKSIFIALAIFVMISTASAESEYVLSAKESSDNDFDMRIEMQGDGAKITLYYDADNEAVKMVYPKEKQTMYGDVEGYYYVNTDGDGWMRTKMQSIMRALNKFVPIDPSFIATIPDKGTFMHKVAYFATEVTISELESSSEARKISAPGAEKTVFQAKDVTITFDEQKRLESLQQGDALISYYYEPQEIKFPAAKTFNLPF